MDGALVIPREKRTRFGVCTREFDAAFSALRHAAGRSRRETQDIIIRFNIAHYAMRGAGLWHVARAIMETEAPLPRHLSLVPLHS